uniref:Protein inhibitor of activated STAT n=1 Tax=Strigamia maritima TaxID=126957 RepID=T1JE32_STRMM
MCDNDELKQMILNFRCSELQVLLGFAGRNKTGRKNELQSRALELLKLRSLPVQMKIKELHRRRYPALSTGNKSYNSVPVPATTAPVVDNSMKTYTASSSATQMTSSRANPYLRVNPLDYSAKDLNPHHTTTSNNYPVHPDVKFKRLPFYDVLGELLKPATLVPSSSSRFQENNFMFHLTPQQASDITLSRRDMRPTAKLEYAVQVQLRFCLLETSCEQDDNFPPSICIKVNSKLTQLPNPIPTNKPNVEPKRPSRPVNVTSSCHLSPTVSNHVNVSWASEFGRGYVVGIFLVRRLNSATLLQRLRAQGVRNADHTRALIKEKLAHDADSEIATTSLRVSLLCPLGKMRMQFPCRAISCSHLQCFDASLYLQMNEKKPTWICPVCDKSAPFDKLVLDGLFMEIFASASESNEIQFHEDGSWSPLIPKKEAHVIGSPMPTKPSQQTVEASPAKSVTSSPAKKKSKVEVVDLTLDSSDDEPEQAKKDGTIFQPLAQNPNINQLIIPSNIASSSGPFSRVSPASTRSGPMSPSSLFADIPLLNSTPPAQFCPPGSSPFNEFLTSHAMYNLSSYDFFPMMGQSMSDRQVPPFGSTLGLPGSSLLTCKPTSTSPDVISLD